MEKEKLYKKMINAYTNAFGDKMNGQKIQVSVAKCWNEIKILPNLEQNVNEKIAEWKKIAFEKKSKLFAMWSKVRIVQYSFVISL